jgi:hypothetical protein
MLHLQPIGFRDACAFIRRVHRHHLPPRGWKLAVAVSNGTEIVGVGIAGRPLARHLDDGWTLEVTRVATDSTKNTASMLYGALWRAARALGYRRMVTYTLIEEPGTSLRASGWRELYTTSGGSWSRPTRLRDSENTGQKRLWEAA